MADFLRVLHWSLTIPLAAASSGCLSEVTWSELPELEAPFGPHQGGRAGAGTPGAGGLDASATGHAGTPGAAHDGGISNGGSPSGQGGAGSGGAGGGAEPCAGEPCLSAARQLLPPAPCAGVPYSRPVSISGGTPPYAWSLGSGSSAEFSLAPEPEAPDGTSARIVSGAQGPMAGGVLHLVVRDASEPPQRLAFDLDLSVRQSCWFAYISASGPGELHLSDVFLDTDVPLAAGGEVLDFEFSPDGRWLAFRASEPEGDRLYTVDVRAPRSALAVPVPPICPGSGAGGADAGSAGRCDVLDYAWSGDSNHLAFIGSGASASGDLLSGVSGFAQGPEFFALWPVIGSALWLADEVPLDYLEALTWIGDDSIGFLGEELGSDSPILTRALYTAEVFAAGSSRPEASVGLLTSAGTRLQPAAGGLALIEPADQAESSVIIFYSEDAPDMYHSGWLSPSGAFVGVVTEENELELYDVRDEDEPVASSADLDAESGCQAIVAWSDAIGTSGRERIACAAGPRLDFYAYDPGAAELEHVARVNVAAAPGVRRAFSPDGRWFVFGDALGTSFWRIDLEPAAPSVDLTPLELGAAPVELLYPPTRSGVVNLADSDGFAEYTLPGAADWPSAFTSPGASPRSACVEAFWNSPDDWCGSPRTARHLAYAPDSKSVLFESAPAELSLAHPATDPVAHPVTSTLKTCSGPCRGRSYAFQP